MRNLKVFFPVVLLAIILSSCGKSDSLNNELPTPVVDDKVILDALLDPAVVAGHGSVVDKVLYIDVDINDLSEPVANAIRAQADQIQMSENINLSQADVEHILGGENGGAIFGNGIFVPKGAFVKMPVNTNKASARGPCLHYCRCWNAGNGELCIDISICY